MLSATSSTCLLSSGSSSMSSSVWVLDFGAFNHMSPYSSSFISLCPTAFVFVMIADDTPMPLAGVGSVDM